MTIQEMHSTFRVLGQQMGMQLVRGILPEAIDVYINQAITEKVQQELLIGVRTALQDSVNTQASTTSVINTFRTLYKTERIELFPNYDDDPDLGNSSLINADLTKIYLANNSYHIVKLPVKGSDTYFGSKKQLDVMMYLGFSVEFDVKSQGNGKACRLIGSDVLETTLRDYCNGASYEQPIVSLNSDINNEETLEIYLNSNKKIVRYLNIKYIKNPNVVKHSLNPDDCVHCDLPAYTHFDIVEKAVQKFFISVGATTGQQQKQQRD